MTLGLRSYSVVICAHTAERWDQILGAVASVQSQLGLTTEVVVAVDHNPELAHRLREALPYVIVVENQTEPGLSGARNSGAAAASGDIIAFLDDDAVAAPDWLAHLDRAYDDPSVAGAGGSIAPLWEADRPTWFPEEFDWVVGCTYRGMPEASARVRNLIGANMSFRRDVWTVSGGFRAGFGQVGGGMLRCDETEFCLRLQSRLPGAILLYVPDARVSHHVPAARGAWAYFRLRCYTEGLAKARLTELAGMREALSSERAYTLRTLPSGIVRGLGDVVTHGDLSGLRRSTTIAAGLALTTAGYLRGRIPERRALWRPAESAASVA